MTKRKELEWELVDEAGDALNSVVVMQAELEHGKVIKITETRLPTLTRYGSTPNNIVSYQYIPHGSKST